MLHDVDDDEIALIQAEMSFRRRQAAHLAEHPHCDDPDHPGCAYCVFEELGANHEHRQFFEVV